MIKCNTDPEICHSALQNFMRNVLQVQNHSQLRVIDDNVKKSPPPAEKKNQAILQFTVEEVENRWPTSPINSKPKLSMHRRWGDLHYEPQQRQLRKEEQDKIAASNDHRFNCRDGNRSNDRPLPSSVIGGHVAMLRQNSLERHFLTNDRPLPSSVIGGHVAMLRQRSLERHFLAKDRPLPSSVIGGHVAMLRQKSLERHFLSIADDDDAEKEERSGGAFCLPTLPEDGSFHDNLDAVVGSTCSPRHKKRRQEHHKKKCQSNRNDVKSPGKSCCLETKKGKSDLEDDESGRKKQRQEQPARSTE